MRNGAMLDIINVYFCISRGVGHAFSIRRERKAVVNRCALSMQIAGKLDQMVAARKIPKIDRRICFLKRGTDSAIARQTGHVCGGPVLASDFMQPLSTTQSMHYYTT